MKDVRITKEQERELLAGVSLNEAIAANLRLKKLGIFDPEKTEDAE